MTNLMARHAALGAVWSAMRGVEVVAAYAAGPAREHQALRAGAAIVDSSADGRFSVGGADRIAFLQRMSTNDLQSLATGRGTQTVLTTAEGRIVDLLAACARTDDLLVLASASHRQRVANWFRQNIFFRDKVKVTDLGSSTAQLSLLGPQVGAVLARLGVKDLAGRDGWNQRAITLAGNDTVLITVPVWPVARYELIVPNDGAPALWDSLVNAGAEPAGHLALEALRVAAGIPAGGAELTADYNPLEAGLRHVISFSKGCYTGQEVIARTENYQKLKWALMRLTLDRMPDAELPLALGDDGWLTSCVRLPDSQVVYGLGYVRAKLATPGASFAITGGGCAVIASAAQESIV